MSSLSSVIVSLCLEFVCDCETVTVSSEDHPSMEAIFVVVFCHPHGILAGKLGCDTRPSRLRAPPTRSCGHSPAGNLLVPLRSDIHVLLLSTVGNYVPANLDEMSLTLHAPCH